MSTPDSRKNSERDVVKQPSTTRRAPNRRELINPFTPTAVARIFEDNGDWSPPVTVQTPSLRDALSYVDTYLTGRSTSEGRWDRTARPQGQVLTVLGEYGTGKTHLASEVLRYAKARGGDGITVMYLDAEPESFSALYRRFVRQVKERKVRSAVQGIYRRLIVEALERDVDANPISRPVIDRLNKGDYDIDYVVATVGLPEMALRQELETTLSRITKNASFGLALSLLLRDGFQDAVWSWLAGEKPDGLLAERGITGAIDTEESALEALGVFSVLFTEAGQPFLLAIDELERLITVGNRPGDTVLAAFRGLLDVFERTGAFLLITGLPDFFEALPDDVRARVGPVIEMQGFDRSHLEQFIKLSQAATNGEKRLRPFTSKSVDYIVELTRGMPRPTIRLCYHCYARAINDDIAVSDALVSQVAADHLALVNRESVRARASRLLEREGWSFVPYYQPDEDNPDVALDFWVQAKVPAGGWGLLLAEGVDSQDVVRELHLLRSSLMGARILVATREPLTGDTPGALTTAAGLEPLFYHSEESFEFTFTRFLRSHSEWRYGQAEDPEGLNERLDALGRQQGRLLAQFETLIESVDNLRSSTENRLALLGTTIRDPLLVAESDAESPETALPPEAAVELNAASATLAEIRASNELVGELFMSTVYGRADQRSRSLAVRSILRSADGVTGLGVVTLLDALLASFRGSLELWHADQEIRRLSVEDRRELLADICETYESIYEYVPLSRLDALLQTDESGPHRHTLQKSQLAADSVREALDGLGARINVIMQSGV